ncbi:DUF4179 domain-containing protein [Acinetobacter sp. WZC-1]|uniref:DUF4179 domain-containing protein n=1 Tax=Acinetobacter sp. WZC-1 TaxID=3459034 RepID=UPI00403E2632
MNTRIYKTVGLSFLLSLCVQAGHTAIIKDTQKQISSPIVTEKLSPIEKALTQQKRGDNKLVPDNDQLRVLTSIKAAPTQNFFAEQHQRFSRFVQAFLQPHNS